MRSAPLFALFILLAVSCFSQTQEAFTAASPRLRVGDSWTYRRVDLDRTYETTVKVLRMEVFQGHEAFVLGEEYPDWVHLSWVDRFDGSTLRDYWSQKNSSDTKDIVYTPKLAGMPCPLSVGVEWIVEGGYSGVYTDAEGRKHPFNGSLESMHYKIVAEGKVKVEAGIFEVYQVAMLYRGKLLWHEWFSPNAKAYVKGEAYGEDGRVTISYELVKYAFADFTVSLDESSFTLKPGEAFSTPIRVTSSNGFSGIVTLQAGSLPSGVECAIDNPEIYVEDALQQGMLTVATSPLTREGVYTIFISASGDGIEHATAIHLVIKESTWSCEVTGVDCVVILLLSSILALLAGQTYMLKKLTEKIKLSVA